MGWNLERISLGSLIIALGLLVDDAIIALEMMIVKMETAETVPPGLTTVIAAVPVF